MEVSDTLRQYIASVHDVSKPDLQFTVPAHSTAVQLLNGWIAVCDQLTDFLNSLVEQPIDIIHDLLNVVNT